MSEWFADTASVLKVTQNEPLAWMFACELFLENYQDNIAKRNITMFQCMDIFLHPS